MGGGAGWLSVLLEEAPHGRFLAGLSWEAYREHPETEQAEGLAVGKEKVQNPLMVVRSTHFLSFLPFSPIQALIASFPLFSLPVTLCHQLKLPNA